MGRHHALGAILVKQRARDLVVVSNRPAAGGCTTQTVEAEREGYLGHTVIEMQLFAGGDRADRDQVKKTDLALDKGIGAQE